MGYRVCCEPCMGISLGMDRRRFLLRRLGLVETVSMIHPNSIAAYQELSTESRCEAILYVYRSSPKPLTDRQVKVALGLDEMNAVRPRISEMIKEERPRLKEVDKVKCATTGKRVRIVTLTRVLKQGRWF